MIRQNSYSTDVDVEFCNIKINGKADSFDYFCRSFSKEKVELRLPEGLQVYLNFEQLFILTRLKTHNLLHLHSRGPKSLNFPDGNFQRAKTFRTKWVNGFRDKKNA